MADASDLVATFDKNATERVKISIDEFRGKKLVNVRVWYTDRESGQEKPGKQGFAINVEKFDALMTGLNKVKEKLDRQK